MAALARVLMPQPFPRTEFFAGDAGHRRPLLRWCHLADKKNSDDPPTGACRDDICPRKAEVVEHDPKLAAYYRGISKHLDLLSLPAPGDRFTLVQVVGEGTYGEVYAARDKLTDRLVAVKIMENIADNVEEMEEEHRVLRDLCVHPNIPTYFGIFFQPAACREDDQVWFVMELCTGGSVTDLVQGLRKASTTLPERTIAYILRETMDALRFLHTHHCMHRDVKGHNILLTETGSVKLVDFGVSSHLDETMGKRNTSVGTPYWMAPEVSMRGSRVSKR
ncbi:unnamed protein product [Ixodes pacificus]